MTPKDTTNTVCSYFSYHSSGSNKELSPKLFGLISAVILSTLSFTLKIFGLGNQRAYLLKMYGMAVRKKMQLMLMNMFWGMGRVRWQRHCFEIDRWYGVNCA